MAAGLWERWAWRERVYLFFCFLAFGEGPRVAGSQSSRSISTLDEDLFHKRVAKSKNSSTKHVGLFRRVHGS